MKKYPLIFIVGPTATGKTEVAVELAKRISAEIISCDSMVVYKEPKILVNKPDCEIYKQARHHMIDIISVEEEFDVYRFKKEVDEIVEENYPGKNLIFVGGSGLYVKILLDGIFDEGGPSFELRDNLKKAAKEKGIQHLYNKLKEVDLHAALKINPNDLRRITRALEIYYGTQKPISIRQKETKGYWAKFPIRIFGLSLNRKTLYDNINKRTGQMFEQGAVDEVKELFQRRLSKTAGKILGLKEIKNYLQGGCTKAESMEELKKNTRRFAKRQLTWFRKEKRIHWIDTHNKQPGEIAEEILSAID
jgi:tRNA dimethylallyltransferase